MTLLTHVMQQCSNSQCEFHNVNFTPQETVIISMQLLFSLFSSKGEQKSGWLSAGPQVEVGEFYCRHLIGLKSSGNFGIAQKIQQDVTLWSENFN